MARLPKDGEYDWGQILEGYLKQSLDHNGNLVSSPTNPHTGLPNPNLADNTKAGLVRLAGDIGPANSGPAAGSPKVTGLQGNPVSSNAPAHGQTLVWNAHTGQWEPASTGTGGFGQSLAINSMRI
jgi:hypothetical protein